MRTASQAAATALAMARLHTRIRSGMCDHYVASYYGLKYSGFPTASSHYSLTPAEYRHGSSTSPPIGALVYWGEGAGHVAISVGNGLCASTDYPRTGYVGVAEITAITTNWNKPYIGWTDAWYATQGVVVIGQVIPPQPKETNVLDPTEAQLDRIAKYVWESAGGRPQGTPSYMNQLIDAMQKELAPIKAELDAIKAKVGA